jgi:hypothetical protein
MGQHPDVLAAMHRAIDLSGAEREARATSPGPTGNMSSSKPNSPTFTARTPR